MDSTRIKKMQVNSLLVSTIELDGGQYETMVLEGSSDLLCLRADNEEDALSNHQRGVEFAYAEQKIPF